MQPKTSIINLNSLLDLSASLYLSDDTDFIMNATMLSLMGKLLITKAAVYQYDISSNIYLPRIIKANFNIQIDNPQLSYEFEDLSKSGNNIPLYLQGVNYIVPIKINKEIFAVILLGKSIIEHTLSEEEANYINLVSNIAGNAVINALSIKSSIIAKEKAERHNQLLKTLFEIGRDFSTFISREQIIKNLSLNLMGQLTVSRFAVYVIDENQNFEELVNRFNLQFSQIWLQNICKSEIAERISNCNIHDSDPIARDISIIAPMKVKGNHKGMMLIGYKMSSSDFTDNDILFIEALGNTAIAALENERLIHEEMSSILHSKFKITYFPKIHPF